MDKFIVETNHPTGWRILRVTPEGSRHRTPGRFRKEHTAQAAAYKMQVAEERRYRKPFSLAD